MAMADQPHFDYHQAFSRNIGWVTEAEQALLRHKRVAIAGLGGVGGSHLLTLTRLGIGAFHIADLDRFELANFNRQAGATLSSIGRPKTEVLEAMARDINPDLEIRRFDEGMTAENLDAFLQGVDLYLDSLDFFAVEARRMVFAACHQRDIPAVTAAPLGMGTAVLNFLPGRMSFEEYFRLEGQPEKEQLLRFLLGLAPAGLHRAYLADPSTVDLAAHRGPSTPMACELCAGVAASQVLKILLHRGPVLAAPWGLQFDAYRNRLRRTWRPGGNANPLQRLVLAMARRQFQGLCGPGAVAEAGRQAATPAERVLELARWAPSGDNTQPWRFEILAEDRILVHGRDTRNHCIYDLQGHASQLSLGILLETMDIAASGEGRRAVAARRPEAPEDAPLFDVYLEAAPERQDSPLRPYIPLRAVQRRPFSRRPLRAGEKTALESAVGEDFRVVWLEGRRRGAMARLMALNGKLRLTLPEAFQTHASVIEWRSRTSEDRIPDEAVGLDPLALRLMRWVMKDWKRVNFMNRYLGGTLIPRLELDFLPALGCAAHFVLVARRSPQGIDDYVAAGRAVQRFWLTASRLGLLLQPEMTPLIFAEYLRQGIEFTGQATGRALAGKVVGRLQTLLGEEVVERAVFMGRVGEGRMPSARSLRLPLARLWAQ